jgi:carbon-monoxide dehydrogenase medium subunit
MKPAPFDYAAARDLDHALALFSETEGEAKYIAGGQTLGPMLNLRLTQPDRVIDLGRIAALRGARTEAGRVLFGAAVRHAEIEDGRHPDPSAGLMPQAAARLAYRAVRNRGTLGGSLAHADPAAEWPNILLALDATVHLHGQDGTRALPLGEFQQGYLTTALAPDEILTGVSVPILGPGARWGYRKHCRQPGEYAESLAITVIPAPGTARCVLGCAGPVPLLLGAVSALVAGMSGWQEGTVAGIAAALDADLDAAGVEADALDRRMHAATLTRSIRDALA